MASEFRLYLKTKSSQGLSWGIAERLYGVSCYICGRRERKRENLHIHHLDKNNNNQHSWNLVWAHKFCHKRITQENGQHVGRGKKSKKDLNIENDAIIGQSLSEIGANVRVGETTDFNPPQTATQIRSNEISRGVLKYLFEVAIKHNETVEEIVKNAPGWINKDKPPSQQAVRRWVDIYSGRFYPYRFDVNRRIYLDQAEYVEKED